MNADSALLLRNFLEVRRKVFVSYHHNNDQYLYNEFSRTFADTFDILRDNSLDRRIDSDNVDYVIRCIRENYVTGSSCTFVLCGAETPWRKFVDWEIKATLDAQHGLIGVNLPTNPPDANGKYTIPDRLHDNIESGYALWTHWNEIVGSPLLLSQRIEDARSRPKYLISNSRLLRPRNG